MALAERIRGRRGDVLALGVLAAAVLLLYSSVITGRRSLLAFFDNANQSYAWFNFAARDGALWDPYQFGGHTFVGELQTALFYPLNQLLFLATGAGITGRGITAFLLAHVLMAAVFQYAFLRVLGLVRPGAVVGAMVFALGGYMLHRLSAQANIFVAATWLPLVFLLFHLALHRAVWIALPAGGALGVSILAGHLQPPAFAILGIAAYGAWYAATTVPRPRAAGRAAVAFGATLAVAFAVAAVQLIPSLEYQDRAVRFVGQPEPVPGDARLPYDLVGHHFLVEPGQVDGFLSPAFANIQEGRLYVGIVALILAAIGLWRGPRRFTVFWGLLALLSLLYSMGHHAGVHFVAYSLIPFLDSIREPARGLILTSFSLSVLAGYGAAALAARETLFPERSDPGAPVILPVAAAGFLAAVLLFVWAVDGKPAVGNGDATEIAVALAIFTLAIVVLRGFGWLAPATAGALCVIALALDLVPTGQPTFALTKDYDGKGNVEPHRFYSKSPMIRFLQSREGAFRVSNPFGAIPKNSGDVHEIEMVQGHAASMTADTYALLATGGAPPSRAHDLLNARYAVTEEPVAGWRKVYSYGGASVYENPGALPRAFLASRWEVQPDGATALRRATSEPFPYRDSVVLDSQPREAKAAAQQLGEVRVVSHEPAKIVLESVAAAPAVLVVSEFWYPGWSAEVEGSDRRIMRADGVLRAVEVPAGTQRVTMSYRPTHWGLAVALSLGGAALVVGVSVVALVRRRNAPT